MQLDALNLHARPNFNLFQHRSILEVTDGDDDDDGSKGADDNDADGDDIDDVFSLLLASKL